MTTYKFTEKQARQFITEQHRALYDALLLATRHQVMHTWPRLPGLKVTDSAFRHCGQYSGQQNLCTYSLPYCVCLGEEYADTVAHELAHAFTHFIEPLSASHGTLFMTVMTLAKPGCDPRREVYHSYSPLSDGASGGRAARGTWFGRQ